MKTIHPSIFDNLEVKKELDRIHEQFVLVSADKAGNTVAFVCKTHCLNGILVVKYALSKSYKTHGY